LPECHSGSILLLLQALPLFSCCNTPVKTAASWSTLRRNQQHTLRKESFLHSLACMVSVCLQALVDNTSSNWQSEALQQLWMTPLLQLNRPSRCSDLMFERFENQQFIDISFWLGEETCRSSAKSAYASKREILTSLSLRWGYWDHSRPTPPKDWFLAKRNTWNKKTLIQRFQVLIPSNNNDNNVTLSSSVHNFEKKWWYRNTSQCEQRNGHTS
jgi:hypothetical protein